MYDEETMALLRLLPPYERLSAVGLTIVTVHRDGESWDEVRDKRE